MWKNELVSKDDLVMMMNHPLTNDLRNDQLMAAAVDDDVMMYATGAIHNRPVLPIDDYCCWQLKHHSQWA